MKMGYRHRLVAKGAAGSTGVNVRSACFLFSDFFPFCTCRKPFGRHFRRLQLYLASALRQFCTCVLSRQRVLPAVVLSCSSAIAAVFRDMQSQCSRRRSFWAIPGAAISRARTCRVQGQAFNFVICRTPHVAYTH